MIFISLQLFLLSRYFNFCLDCLVKQQNLRSKGNQTMKFDQLTEYSMRNIFLEKSYTKNDGETSPRPFSEKLKVNLSLDQQSKVSYSLYLCYAKLRVIKIETKLQTTCFYLILRFTKKQKELWNYFSCYILLIDHFSLPGCLYFMRY